MVFMLSEKENPTIKKDIVTTNNDWLNDPKETILLYGNPKIGKTFAYCSILDKKIKEGSDIYLINTDGGIAKTLKQYFGEDVDKISSKLHFYFIGSVEEAFNTITKIKNIVKDKDVIVIDLISDFWELEQAQFITELGGENPLGMFVKGMKDPARFGLFLGSQWQYIKKLDNFIIDSLIIRPPCNTIIATSSSKDVEIEKSISGVKKHSYDVAGARPSGSPSLPYKFNTIVYIGLMENKRYFMITGDRGVTINPTMITYERNFYEKFLEIRNKKC